MLNNFASKRATNHSAKTISIQGETNKPGIIILADSLKRRRENKRSQIKLIIKHHPFKNGFDQTLHIVFYNT